MTKVQKSTTRRKWAPNY